MALAGLLIGSLPSCVETDSDSENSRVSTTQAAATYDHPPIAGKELLITDLSVVDDAAYTNWQTGKVNTDKEGGWSFARLLDNMSPVEKPTPAQRTRFALQWLKLWEAPQVVNSFVVPARPAIRDLVINPWRADSGCSPDAAPPGVIASGDTCVLNFQKAPFRLLAIVNRPDLRIPVDSTSVTVGSAGQGRFVFGVLSKDAAGAERRLSFTIIFEYRLPISGSSDIIAWAERWHKLGKKDVPFGAKYNEKLHEVTREFTKWRVMNGTPNGSALLQVRTNEVSLSHDVPKIWEMREFVLSGSGDRLVQTTVKLEPDGSFNNTATLASYVTANEAALLAGTHDVPNLFQGSPFLAGRSLVPNDFVWNAPGAPKAARDRFAIGTCGGCHFAETGGLAGTNFLHVKNRARGAAAALSPFLGAALANERVNDFAALLQTADATKIKKGPGLDRGNETTVAN